ncbi:MAG: SIR2 family protein [Pyrinomonadaceae bacterium]
MTENQSTNAIGVLARSLANNYAHSAVVSLKDKGSAIIEHILEDGSLDRAYDRSVVVIVGSGASQAAGLVGTDDFFNKLLENTLFDPPNEIVFPLSKEIVDVELERLRLVQRLDPEQFETRLLAMSATESSGLAVRKALEKKYNRRFLPTLAYEILAHLLKHRFVDAIISFNFDELLDQAIEDELNPEEYHRIISDGDGPSYKLPTKENEILKKPLYIKPHGTVSHPSTLRFTRDDYYRLPEGIRLTIRSLLSGRPVDLISVGFNMKSFEFNSIANESDQSGSRIFHINIDDMVNPDPSLKSFTAHRIQVVDKPGALDEVLHNILQKTHSHLGHLYKPRSIDRHRILAGLFKGERDKTEDNSPYLWDRTVIELALAIAKAKGFVTMSELSSGRPGKYFTKYQQNVGKRIHFRKLCEDLGLNEIAYGFDALRLSDEDNLRAEILLKPEFKAALEPLLNAVKSKLKGTAFHSFEANRDLFRETLWMHYSGAEVELRFPPKILHDNLFLAPVPITSKRVLDCQTVAMLKGDDWNYVLLVSETGEWLEHERVIAAIKSREIFVIVADDSRKPYLEAKYPGKIEVAKMNWWDHNRHLTLFVNKDQKFLDQEPKALRSIYFTRPRRATDIVPVLLDENDSKIVFDYWKAYWLRATEVGIITKTRMQGFKFPPDPVKAEDV